MYNPQEIEPKRQKIWREQNAHTFDPSSKKPKYYILVMFPYPSGRIHMGHVRNYVIGDVFARYFRLKGYEVFHPIGWDSFGLPAENAAIKNKIPPRLWTETNIEHMKKQLARLGISYDWSSELATSRPEYYKWNQWFFLKMFDKGLAYRKQSAVNWCPKCATVLANEQVISGACWRCSSEVETKDLEQWFIKITDYAQALLDGHKALEKNWPDEVLTMQRNWLGRSEGAEVEFALDGTPESLRIFTTRPDTLFGATFMVVAPEHPLSIKLAEADKKIADYASEAVARRVKSHEDSKSPTEKTGVFSGLCAVNPVNGEKIPVWISDYVTMDYGTGAIMCVPAHDQRDFDFAKKYSLEIRSVIKPKNAGINKSLDGAYEAEGEMINSGDYDGLDNKEGARRIVKELAGKNLAKAAVHWRIKDWLISRQRYWGTPIPVVYCPKCGIKGVNEKDLPVKLPDDIAITGSGESPLASHKSFVEAKCPDCGGPARRETDTMDTFVDSSWYYARYCDPKNTSSPFDKNKAAMLLPVDQYVGGIEHACMHLIYSRFWHKFMRDAGLVTSDEPFAQLLTQGMVTLKGETMSKSKGNIVEPDEIIQKYGADALRLFIMFAAPPSHQLDWSDSGLEGIRRFLNRVSRLAEKATESDNAPARPASPEESLMLKKIAARTVAKVARDIEIEKQFNTAVSSMMELVNAMTTYSSDGDEVWREALESLLIILSPFAPHFAQETLATLRGEAKDKYNNKDDDRWPDVDEKLLSDDEIEIAVQINGKVRAHMIIPADMDEKSVYEKVLADEKIKQFIDGKKMVKYVYIPKKIVSIVVK
ncbi:MAG: leucine--tRNA ligase [Endomicrobiia bacterium]|nr:leucine--tRNA ligase [Endomicrobiia bacterium]